MKPGYLISEIEAALFHMARRPRVSRSILAELQEDLRKWEKKLEQEEDDDE